MFFQGEELFITGNYGEIDSDNINSFFVFKSTDEQLVKMFDGKVPVNLLKEGLSEKGQKRIDKKIKKKKYSPMYNYKAKRIVKKMDNSGYIILLEESYVLFASSSPVPYYKDILVFSIDEKLNIEWSKKIRKVQRENDFLSSFQVFKNKSSISLLFNDNTKNYDGLNYNSSNLDVVFTKANNDVDNEKTKLAIVNIDYNGKIKRELFFKNNETVNEFVIYEDNDDEDENELIMLGGVSTPTYNNNEKGAELLRIQLK